jgi:hypothetical protein
VDFESAGGEVEMERRVSGALLLRVELAGDWWTDG